MISTMNTSLQNNIPHSDKSNPPSVSFQRKHPNGSTTRATKSELSMNDAKAKIAQAAKLVSTMSSVGEKQVWREKQRKAANEIFAKGGEANIKEAMDIYLTGLVVDDDESVDDDKSNHIDDDDDDKSNHIDDDDDDKSNDHPNHILKIGKGLILSNLVVCALALKQYKQSLQFADLLLADEKAFPPGAPVSIVLPVKVKTCLNGGSASARIGEWDKAEKYLRDGEAFIVELESMHGDVDVGVMRSSLERETGRLARNRVSEKQAERVMKETMKKNFAKRGAGAGTKTGIGASLINREGCSEGEIGKINKTSCSSLSRKAKTNYSSASARARASASDPPKTTTKINNQEILLGLLALLLAVLFGLILSKLKLF